MSGVLCPHCGQDLDETRGDRPLLYKSREQEEDEEVEDEHSVI